jgi:hypothetical protein
MSFMLFMVMNPYYSHRLLGFHWVLRPASKKSGPFAFESGTLLLGGLPGFFI